MKTLRNSLLTMVMLLCSITSSAHSFERDGIYYSITSSKNLTVKVTYQGASYDSYDDEYTGKVVIPESVTYNGNTYSVTSIGERAFSSCDNLASVTIGNSVTSIGDDAFFSCDDLASVTIGNSVTTIGTDAFSYCENLTSITIGNSVTSIGDNAFNKCDGLTSVYITNIEAWCKIVFDSSTSNPLRYAKHLYLSGEKVKDLIIPESVTSIGDYAFYSCSDLTSVTIGNSVTSIGTYAFYSCSDLTSVTIGNSVTSIGDRAFSSCDNLTSVTIGNSVTSIGSDAFCWCDNLTSVYITDLEAWCKIVFDSSSSNPLCYAKHLYLNGEEVKDLIIPESVTSIGDYAFYSCSDLTSVTIGNSVTSIGTCAFFSCDNLTSVTIGNSVTSIGNSAFSSCDNLASVTIGNSVTSIGDNAFSSCDNLTSVTIGNSVTSIGSDAFCWCDNLTSVYITDLEAWCKIVFDSNSYIGMTSNPLNYAKHLYLNGEEVKDLIIPESVTNIGDYAFYGFSGLTSVTIGNSVTSIGTHAFSYCKNLTSVTIGNSVTSIGERAFSSCDGLTNVTIPNSVTSIGDYAFHWCLDFTSVTIGNSVKIIGENAFEYCSIHTVINYSTLNIEKGSSTYGNVAYYAKVVIDGDANEKVGDFFFRTDVSGNYYLSAYIGNEKTLMLPENYKGENYGIDACVFSFHDELVDVTIPNSVTSIGDNAFSWCSGLTSVTIPNSVTSIGGSVFYKCSQLTSVTIGNSVTSIGDYAFCYCPVNTLVMGAGITSIGGNQTTPTKTIWLANTPPSGYSYLSGKINYVANEQYSSLSNTKVYPYLRSMFEVDGVTYVPVNMSERTCDAIDIQHDVSVENTAINSTVSYKGVTMTVKELMPYIGNNNKYIKSVTISKPGNISESAFSGCTNLQEVSLGEITSIGSSAFSGCSSLPEITIPQSVTSINDYAFNKCTSLADVIIADRTQSLSLGSNGSSPLFADCPLDSVYIGGKVTYETLSGSGYSPFYRNTSLRSVTIGHNEETVYNNEFYGCTNLKNVSIGNGVKSIGNWAFSGCSSLDYFAFGENVESIGQEAFSDCTNMTQLISSAVVPPTCGAQALENINKWNCTLKVPKGYTSAYQAADQWKDFFFLEEFVSALKETAMDKAVPTNVDVYTLQGVKIREQIPVESLENELPRGIYIVNGKKVMVR